MDREGFAKVSRWCRESNVFSRKFNVTQLLYYGCHHKWRMSEIQDCIVTFCESFAKVLRELRESLGWDLKGGALSSLNYLTFILTLSLSLSYSHSLNLSTSLCHSLSVCLFLAPFLSGSLSVSPTLSLLLSVCLYLSLSLFLVLLLNELVIRIMHGDGSAKVSRKVFSLVKVAISGTRTLGQHPYLYIHMYVYSSICFVYLLNYLHICMHVYIEYIQHMYIYVHIYIHRHFFGICMWIYTYIYIYVCIFRGGSRD